MVRSGAFVGFPKLLERCQAVVEGALARGEALADDVGHVMVDDVLLGIQELLETLDPEGLGGGAGDQHDVRERRRCVRPLDIERDFEVPKVVGFQARAIVRRRRDRSRTALDLDDVEARVDTRRTVAGRVVRPGLAAEMREVEGGVEDGQVLPDRR